jgi:hypothetical protein
MIVSGQGQHFVTYTQLSKRTFFRKSYIFHATCLSYKFGSLSTRKPQQLRISGLPNTTLTVKAAETLSVLIY